MHLWLIWWILSVVLTYKCILTGRIVWFKEKRKELDYARKEEVSGTRPLMAPAWGVPLAELQEVCLQLLGVFLEALCEGMDQTRRTALVLHQLHRLAWKTTASRWSFNPFNAMNHQETVPKSTVPVAPR